MVVVPLLPLLLVGFQDGASERYERDAAWCCAHLERCTQWREANLWLWDLRDEPGAKQRLDAAYRRLGENRRLDFWLLTAHPPDEISRRSGSSEPRTGNADEPGAPWKGALERELVRAPEKRCLQMHWKLYRHGQRSSEWLIGNRDYLQRTRRELTKWLPPEQQPDARPAPRGLSPRPSALAEAGRQPDPERVVRTLRTALTLCARYDLLEGLTPERGPRVYRAWAAWLDENHDYLRYDPREARFVIDQDAQRAGRPLPPEAREISGALDPLPDWQDGLVEIDDWHHAQALRRARRHCVAQGLEPGTEECYRAEARFCLQRLDQMPAKWEAMPWWQAIQIEPGAQVRLDETGRRLLTGMPRADYWVLLRGPGFGREPMHEFRLQNAFYGPLVERAAAHPSIVKRVLHFERFRTRFRDGGAAFLMKRMRGDEWKQRRFDEICEEVQSWHVNLWSFMEPLTLSGRSDLVRGLTAENFRSRLLEWCAWYRENGRYLRFDEQRGHLVVDEDAKRAGREIPLFIPPAEKPFPDWKGSLPVLRRPRRPRPVTPIT